MLLRLHHHLYQILFPNKNRQGKLYVLEMLSPTSYQM